LMSPAEYRQALGMPATTTPATRVEKAHG